MTASRVLPCGFCAAVEDEPHTAECWKHFRRAVRRRESMTARHDQTTLDATDHEIGVRRMQAVEDRIGPGVGDFVDYPDGTTRRISHVWWDEDYQTSDGGSFYLGEDGYVSFSGGLHPSAPLSDLRPTADVRHGRAWFFHHNHRRAHNGVTINALWRVWRTDSEPTR